MAFRSASQSDPTREARIPVDVWDVALLAMIWAHVRWAPFTKVEESFNVQAMHDLLFHRFHLSQYDHFEFPGVVPRTFLGALLVAGLSSPLVAITHLFGASKITALVIVRGTLGFLVFLSFYMLRRQIATSFGTPTARYFALLLLSQFHLPFYASRPLPNVFALALANLAFTYWIKGKAAQALQTLVFAFVVFRCDMLILLVPIGLSLWLTGSIGFFYALFTCVLTGIASLILTVSVDSVLWRRFPLWPEGTVLFFNTALNRSSEWGVSSPHWYFTSALPRALLLAYPLSFVAPILDRRMLRFFLPALTFVGLYSFLPHKELRFLFPGLPLFLLCAARGLVRLQVLLRATAGRSGVSKTLGRVARPLVLLAMAVSCLLSSLFALASYRNYPGSAAAILLQQKVGHEPGSVHVDVLPAMTGFSRFTQLPAPWSYSKQEGLTLPQLSHSNFSYLLSAHPSVPSYEPVANATGFVRMSIGTKTLLRMPPLRIPFPVLETEPRVFIHKKEAAREERKPDVVPPEGGAATEDAESSSAVNLESTGKSAPEGGTFEREDASSEGGRGSESGGSGEGRAQGEQEEQEEGQERREEVQDEL